MKKLDPEILQAHIREGKRAYSKANRDKYRQWNRTYKERHRDRLFVQRAMNYGASLTEAQEALTITACEGCSATGSLHIDHHHDDRRYRGMLCGSCNTALGYFRDDPHLLVKAVEYLNDPIWLAPSGYVASPDGLCAVCHLLPARKLFCSKQCKWRAKSIRSHLTLDQYHWLRLEQNDMCAICARDLTTKKYRGPYIDHDHVTGRVRGLLCLECNLGLGLAQDSTVILSQLIDYLGGA